MSESTRLQVPERNPAAPPPPGSLLAGPTARARAIADSDMAAAIAAFDWSSTPLGPTEGWPQSLKSAVRLMLGSRYPMFIWWGRELVALYNDAYVDVLGPRHPWALGRPARETWAEIWDVVGPQSDAVLHQGSSTWNDRVLLVMERSGFAEETYFTFSYSPCFGDTGAVGGVFCTCTEETARVLGERRLHALGALSAAVLEARSAVHACTQAAAALAANRHDLPFVLFYLQDASGDAVLAAQAGADDPAIAVPRVALAAHAAWPLERAAQGRAPVLVEDVARRAAVPAGPWPEPVRDALVLPLALPHGGGFMVAGLNPRRPLDEAYQAWLGLVAQQVASAVAGARSFEEAQQRASALAELDRAKTTFFSNVSHELRTPLALMLAPVGDLLDMPGLPEPARQTLALAQRNGHRLHRLVDALLDVSRIEAGGMQARFRPVDLAASTRELASFFDSAVRRAGLRLQIDCGALPQPVYVDAGMWEKIVFNLLSNAIKYTPAGAVRVVLKPAGSGVRLEVQDTGVGMSPEDHARVFDRFYRAERTGGRSVEGTGIGLSLVAELVRLHGGTVQVESRPGGGSTFGVDLPWGRAHLPPDQVDESAAEAAAHRPPHGWLEEIDGWTPAPAAAGDAIAAEADRLPEETAAASAGGTHGDILLVDDNADMRTYLSRLLGREHTVRTASDGFQALQRIAERMPDLVLTDAMMSRMDGFALLGRLRAAPATATLPVVVLTADGGEEARLRALDGGADDVLVKPFHGRELLARVSGTLRLAQVRRAAMEREQALRAQVEGVLESITEGFVAVDARWRFTYVNRTAETIYGRSREDLVGRDMWECFPELGTSAFGEPFRRAMHSRESVTVEGPYDPLGSQFEVKVFPVEGGGLSFYFRDVLQSRLMERAVRDSERRFREMAESMPQIVYVQDATGRIEYVNGRWAAYTGARGTDPAEFPALVHPDDLPQLMARWNQAFADGLPLTAEFRLRAADGSWRWFLTRAMPVMDDQGRIERWYGTSTDIDGSRRDAEALAQAHAALQQVERRKDQFIATLAHELRNPLAPLRNGVHLLSLGGGPDGGTRVQAMMRRQIDQLVRLVDDLLEVSRITSGKIVLQRSPTSLHELLTSTAESSRPVVEAARHSLHVDVDETAGLLVDADAMRLGQVFANLLNNAAKYTEPGGHIAMTAARDGATVVVRVQDNGVGLAPEMLDEVFQPFVQVDRSAARAQGGLGIGLSIVRSLVELHGGKVKAFSAGLDQGAVFEVRLPLVHVPDAASPAGPRRHAPAPMAGGDGPSVLVVDDNRDAADSLGYMLEMMGARTRVVYGGPDALAEAERETPDLVLLDLGMPGMDGYEVARRLAAHPQRGAMRIVALTGWGQSEDRQRTREAGFDEHLVKPAEIDVLDGLLAKVAATA
jgi:PAS domain S-box-containing protein